MRWNHLIWQKKSILPESVRREVKPINGTNAAWGTQASTDISCNLTSDAVATKMTLKKYHSSNLRYLPGFPSFLSNPYNMICKSYLKIFNNSRGINHAFTSLTRRRSMYHHKYSNRLLVIVNVSHQRIDYPNSLFENRVESK